MAGQIKAGIDKVFAEKTRGDQVLMGSIKVKMLLKGIHVDTYTEASPDDPVIMEKLKNVAADLGVRI